jgi:hypothetical protein
MPPAASRRSRASPTRAPFAGVVAARYVTGTDAFLGFTHFPATCTIEVPASLSRSTHDAYEAICEPLVSQRIRFTLHWGQCLPQAFTAASLGDVYGGDVGRWIDARRRFLPTVAARMFANGMTERYGLAA